MLNDTGELCYLSHIQSRLKNNWYYDAVIYKVKPDSDYAETADEAIDSELLGDHAHYSAVVKLIADAATIRNLSPRTAPAQGTSV